MSLRMSLNNTIPKSVGVNTFTIVVLLTPTTYCDGGALVTIQCTNFCLILSLIFCGGRVALVRPNMRWNQVGRPVQILYPNRVRKLLGVWRGGGGDWGGGLAPGGVPGGGGVPKGIKGRGDQAPPNSWVCGPSSLTHAPPLAKWIGCHRLGYFRQWVPETSGAGSRGGHGVRCTTWGSRYTREWGVRG